MDSEAKIYAAYEVTSGSGHKLGIIKAAIILAVFIVGFLIGSIINAKGCAAEKCCTNGTSTMFPACKAGPCK